MSKIVASQCVSCEWEVFGEFISGVQMLPAITPCWRERLRCVIGESGCQERSRTAPFPCYKAQTTLPLAPPISTRPPTTRYDYFSSAPPHHYIPGLQLPLPAVIFHARFLPVCSPAHLHCSCALCLGGEYMQCAECNKYIFIFLAGDLLFFFFFFQYLRKKAGSSHVS